MAISKIENSSLATGVPGRSQLPAGTVLQVVSTTLTTGFTASVNNSYSAVTGLTAAITPTSTTSKILIFITLTVGSDTNYLNAQLTRDGAAITGALATGNGSRAAGTGAFWPSQTYGTYSLAMSYLDSPSSVAAKTYGVQIGTANAGAEVLCINQSQEDSNVAARTRGTSTITVMEIAA